MAKDSNYTTIPPEEIRELETYERDIVLTSSSPCGKVCKSLSMIITPTTKPIFQVKVWDGPNRSDVQKFTEFRTAVDAYNSTFNLQYK